MLFHRVPVTIQQHAQTYEVMHAELQVPPPSDLPCYCENLEIVFQNGEGGEGLGKKFGCSWGSASGREIYFHTSKPTFLTSRLRPMSMREHTHIKEMEPNKKHYSYWQFSIWSGLPTSEGGISRVTQRRSIRSKQRYHLKKGFVECYWLLFLISSNKRFLTKVKVKPLSLHHGL